MSATRINLRYSGKFGRAANGAGAIVREEAAALGEDWRAWIADNSPDDTGESGRETVTLIEGASTRLRVRIIGRAPYSLYSQQFGRQPNRKQPPPLVMLALVIRKGLTLADVRERASHAASLRSLPRKPQVNTLANIRELARRRKSTERRMKIYTKANKGSRELSRQKQLAFLIGRSIGRKGIKAPLLFSRVQFVRRGAYNRAVGNIERRIAALITD